MNPRSRAKRLLPRLPRAHRWRMGAAAAFALAGALFATTALNSGGLDLRAASITDLHHVVQEERERADALQERISTLNEDVSRLSRSVGDRTVNRLQRRVDRLRDIAGFAPVTGPGLTVILDDAPKSVIDAAVAADGATPDELVVHQQDIQAVVNALWSGGAEAITIQNQRVISTTGIKCVGNTVVLHGVPYSPPYQIAAIGDIDALQAALDNSDYIHAYRTFVDAYQLGYAVYPSVLLEFPGYTGTATLTHARATDPVRADQGGTEEVE